MLRIRLKHMPSNKHYRIVLSDSKSSRDGRILKQFGYYAKTGHLYVQVEEMAYWISRGAQPSASLLKILEDCGLLSAELLDKLCK